MHTRSHGENKYAAGHTDQQRLKPVLLLAPTQTYTEHSTARTAQSGSSFPAPQDGSPQVEFSTQTYTYTIWVPPVADFKWSMQLLKP